MRLAASLILLATFCGCIGSAHRFLELSSHFRLQYLVLSTVCLIILVIFRDWRWSVAVLAGVVLNSALVLPWYFPDASRAPASGDFPLRILLSNVLTSNQDAGPLLSLVRAEHPDVLVLEELDARWEQKVAELDVSFPHSRKIARPDNFGIGIWSRFPLSNVEVIESGFFRLPSIQAQIELDGHRFTILATHPPPPVTADGFAERNTQLANLARRARESTLPLVLIGDLNVTMWSPFYTRLIRDSGLLDARKGHGVLATWPAHLPILAIPLDHCLVSRSIRIKAIKRGGNIGSDHLPIIVDLALGKTDAAP
ncbi:MAG TPA: endonuclease/exonuclease/phosphatase family protein [Chthoniobacteraceae bacterium]